MPVRSTRSRTIDDALFRSVKDNVTGEPDQHIDPASVYRNIVHKYGLATGIGAEVCVHSMRRRRQRTHSRMMPTLNNAPL
jgi:hypothetical protein